MVMTSELKAIMKRRLERSENNPNVAFVSPKSALKSKSPFVANMKILGDTNSSPADNDEYDGMKDDTSIGDELKEISHKDLKGKERLFSVVQLLGQSCPWTKSIASKTMLKWLRSELDELEKEIDMFEILKDKREFDFVLQEEENVVNDESLDAFLQSLTSELGDVLFDALMLEMIVRREYKLGESSAWDAASEKIERRTPYMESWGDGKTTAGTPEEATEIWNSIKNEEKKVPLPSFLEKSTLEKEKEKTEEIVVSGLSDELGNQSATKDNDVDRIDETQEKDGSTESTRETDTEKDILGFPSYEQERSNDNGRNDFTNIMKSENDEKKEEQQKSIIEKKDSFPLLNINFACIVGLQKFNEINAVTSASLGFAAGALIVTLLQKIKFR